MKDPWQENAVREMWGTPTWREVWWWRIKSFLRRFLG